MIKINPVKSFPNASILSFKRPLKKDNNTLRNDNGYYSGVPKSYIAFKANNEKSSVNYTEDAKALISKANEIANELNNTEITPFHIIAASINKTYENLNMLNPQAYGILDSISTLNKLANNTAKRNLLLTDNDMQLFIKSVGDFQYNNDLYLEKLPKDETGEYNLGKKDLPISDELISVLEEIVQQTGKIDEYTILAASFNVLTKNGLMYPSQFLENFLSLNYYESRSDVMADYMKAYDTRAVEVWNKLALGSNLYITYDDEKEAQRIKSSIIKTINTPKHGNFNSKNTLIYTMSDNMNPNELVNEIYKKNEEEPGKQKIFMVNLDKILFNSISQTPEGEKVFPMELIAMVQNVKNNVKFIFFQNAETNYHAMQNPIIKKGFSNFITYPIPPMRTYEAQELINKHKKYTREVTTPFTKEARNRAVKYADNIEGVFPDKAINLMKRIASYYGDEKKKITIKDVDNFAIIAKDIFNKDSDTSDIIYDTGKNLASVYGKDTTKKDMEAIVRQIREGKLGTRGYIMYSKDEEAGSGRRFCAQAIAGEAKVPFIEIASSDFAVSLADEEGGDRISPKAAMSKIFAEAKKAAEQNEYKTAIVYVNNFEDFAFSGNYFTGYKQAMAQMEKEMSKAETEHLNILVIGSTDEYYADAIPMFVRGFNQTITIDSPATNRKSRMEILTNRIREVQLPLACKNTKEKEHLLDKLVTMTEYMSFVEIKSLIEKTRQIMLERNKTNASMGDFIEAYLQMATGRTSRPEMPEYNKRATTSHECGHAVNLEVMNEILKEKGKPWHQSRNVNFITLDPRGNFLGAVFEGNSENSDYPFEAMFTGLVCAYGGYSCEKLFFDMDGSGGISQDLAQAAASAKRGVELFGFGYNTGKISGAAGIKSGEYSENVFKDMNVILKNAQIASDLITEIYRGFNEWFTEKYSKLIGSDDCMIDGDTFRALLAGWKKAQSPNMKADFDIMGDIIMEIIQYSKKGKLYGKV